MSLFISIDKKNIEEILAKRKIIVARIRKSRSKCKQLAVLELIHALKEYAPRFITNGPLGDVKGIITIAVKLNESDMSNISNILEYIGYCDTFYILDFNELSSDIENPSINPLVFKGKEFAIKNLIKQNGDLFRQGLADKRDFLLTCGDGVVRNINGYRGNGEAMGRRALPVEDCRLLMNLACNKFTKAVVEPFAGGGGIIYQLKKGYPSLRVVSLDIAQELAYGLLAYGAEHHVANAKYFKTDIVFDALCTEVPFDQNSTEDICSALLNFYEMLTDDAKLAIMCDKNQEKQILEFLVKSDYFFLNPFFVDRKGTQVSVIIAFKCKETWERYLLLWEKLKLFY